MKKYAVYHSPGFDGQSENYIHIFANNALDAAIHVMFISGIGTMNGKTIYPDKINRIVPLEHGSAQRGPHLQA